MFSLFVSTPCLCPLPCSQAEFINKHCLTWSNHLQSPDISWQGGYCLGQPTFHCAKTAFSCPSKKTWHQSVEEEGFVVGWAVEERVRCSGDEMVCVFVIQLSVSTFHLPSMPRRNTTGLEIHLLSHPCVLTCLSHNNQSCLVINGNQNMNIY